MSRFKRAGALLLSLALLAGLLTGCGKTPAPAEEEDNNDIETDASVSGQVLTSGGDADKVFSLCVDYGQKLNPLTTKSSLNQMVDCLVYDMLFEVDDNFNVTSRVLKDWYYSNNVWVLVVRDDITMHDGSLLTAADVAYSVSRIFTAGHTFYQKQAGTVYSSAVGDSVYLAGNRADGLLPWRLAVPIIKQGSVEDETPPGSGPYMFSEDRTCLVKFDGYENSEELPLETIYLRQYTDSESLISEFETGLLDLVVNDPTGIYNMGYGGKNEKRVYNTTNMHYVGFNRRSDFFCYEQYRQAVGMIIDREAIAEDVLDGAAVASALPIHPASSLFDAEMNESLSYNQANCLIALEKLGCRDLDDDGMLEFALSGAKVEIAIKFIVCADSAAKVTAARRIAEDMEAIGLHVELLELSWNQYRDALAHPVDEDDNITFDMYYAETAITPDWDVLPFFEELSDEDYVTNLNYGRWKLPDLEAAAENYLASDEEQRKETLPALLQAFAANAVILPVCFERREVLSHLGIITGMEPNQYNIFHNFANWTIRREN